MQKTTTRNLSSKQENREDDSLKDANAKALAVSELTLHYILSYSKALEVKRSETSGAISQVMN